VSTEKKPRKKKVWALEAAVFSALRRAQRNSPASRDCLNNAKTEYFIPSKKGKPMRRVQFTCANCGAKASRKGVQVDHIDPVIDPLTGFQGYEEYIKRLFVITDRLQVLCKQCHKAKSKIENALRRKVKKESQANGK
jgi:5-methylcytosine-specific restriction endonuclease McrA